MGSEPAGRRRVAAVVGAVAARGRQPGHGAQHLRALSAAGHPRSAARDPGADARAPPAGRPDGEHRDGSLLADRIPGAKFVELEGADHLFFTGDADTLLDEIEEFLTGVRPLPAVERVLATVLFTDIVDSTKRAVQLGDERWKELLGRHDAHVRRQLERFHGREVNTTGDGFLAWFDGPARAIRCAMAIRDALRGLGLEVRAGVHTGEVELRDDDISGIAVHVAARVAAAAGAGEVLVSRIVVDLVAGSGLSFTARASTPSRACRASGGCSRSRVDAVGC